ncbi:MAG: polyribonucleotide nucleotidyltransferase [Candidatus Omnitrophica bacterium]|nr:polyribonucleotide nucleotidyltransferase [Candidatus Omnitrophota bacterium]
MNKAEINFGRNDLIIETGHLAKQANGAVTVQYGATVVLVTACIGEVREDIDFFPLTVEYQEKTYAAGRIPGGFFKREGRPSEKEILSARVVDRSIRPNFPKGMRNSVQIMAVVFSSDAENSPDILAVNGASLALAISNIPFLELVASCRVGLVNNEFILNPTYQELEKSDLDLVVSANKKGIVMLEAKANQVSEDRFIDALKFAQSNLERLLVEEEAFVKANARPKAQLEFKEINPDLEEKITQFSEDRLKEILLLSKKEERQEAIESLSKELGEKLGPLGYSDEDIKFTLNEVERQAVRSFIQKTGRRIDGRDPRDIRPIECCVPFLPRTHGSSLFTRGQTQSLCVTTLGTGEDERLVEALEGEKYKSFMLHYNFPPFSVGETKPVRGPGRREIGHGALAERALSYVMPSKDEFPYTVRVVSEILESNGSSSMATVCSASLALMDAGVPIKDAVAGIALGLIKGKENILLTDIAGVEDYFGDMDLKVAGTKEGVTAVQLDLKIDGIEIDLLNEALIQSREARLKVLEKMTATIASPHEKIADFAPHIQIIKIDPEKIGDLIGPGGKIIKKIISTTGVTVDVEDDGKVLVGSTSAQAQEAALGMIKEVTDDIEIGRVYKGKIKRIMPFGAFCEICRGREGLIHVSELANHFVRNVEDEVKLGDMVEVKVIGIDESGRIKLSKKQISNEGVPEG